MGYTTNFGLSTFTSDGRIEDEGYKFSSRDRVLIDAILYTLANHDHRAVGVTSVLAGPEPLSYPTMEVLSTGGLLPAGQTYYYKFSYMDVNGNETAASVAAAASTLDPITPPTTQVLSTATTGGTLLTGTYKYAIAFYQTAGGVTTAPSLSSIVVPATTTTNTITIPLETLPDGADGWKLYRKAPADTEYWFLDTVASGPTTYVDDGSVAPDCTKRRPTRNTTNSINSISISIPSVELPLDVRVTAWRVYRTTRAGSYPINSLVATVVETTTEGGADLVTTYVDVGAALFEGAPLSQSAIPPDVPQLDASAVFEATGGRLSSALAPLGVRTFNSLLPGALTQRIYHQFVPPHDMLIERIDAYYLTAPTGLTPSTDYLTIRLKDDSQVNEVMSIYNTAAPRDEIQRISTDATSGTFTMSFDGQGPTAAVAYNATALQVATALETLSNIADVLVGGAGTPVNPWVIQFIDPGSQDVAQITVNGAGLVGGTATVSTSIVGSNGGTFTLSDGVSTTSAIAYNAAAATIETRLQTDIAAITDVTVTGAGTQGDPWLVEFVNPGAQQVDLLVANDTALNGATVISEVTEGRGNQIVDLVVDQNQAAHNWQSPLTDYGVMEAEAATGGVQVSDTLALNDVAMELDTLNETNSWNVGTLNPGTYEFLFNTADSDQAATYDLIVTDLNSTTLATRSIVDNRPVYTPAYGIKLTLDGTEDIELSVKKTDASANRVRVDRYAYQVVLPRMYAGQTVTLEAIITGTPSTNGSDLQLSIWY